MPRKLINAGLMILLSLLFFFQGYLGRDFGTHWDESQYVNSVITSVETGTFLPEKYNYPSFCYWLAASNLFPDVAMTVFNLSHAEMKIDTPAVRKPELSFSRELTEDRLLIRVRVLCLAFVSLTLLWTYLLVMVWHKHQGEALAAAAFLGGSYELAYHSRWIAPDALLMQFIVLLMLLIFCALREEGGGFGWLIPAAMVSGLACSTKYPAIIFLLPLLTSAGVVAQGDKVKACRNVLTVSALSLVTFLLVTPGAYVQPVYFVHEILKQKAIYGAGYYGGTVASGFHHLRLALEYLLLVVYSPYLWISALMALFAIFGFIQVLKEKKLRLFLLFGAPAIYFAYFMLQSVMVVRNFLVLFPFMSILAAMGVIAVINRVRIKPLKMLVIGVVLVTICINHAWLFRAAQSIRHRKAQNLIALTEAYLNDNQERKFYLSPAISRGFQAKNLPANVVKDSNDADGYIFITTEYDGLTRMNLRSNVYNRYHLVAGSRDVNINYYPAWVEKKVLEVSVAEARLMALL